MSEDFVVGFDIGTSTSYVVIGKDNGIESLINEYSDRNTPVFIGFTEKIRIIGNEAKQQQITNISNTVYNFSKLLGKPFNDSLVQKDINDLAYKVISIENNRIGIEVMYLNEKCIFTPEQLYAMQLTKLKEVAEKSLRQKIVDVVINVPTFATESERKSIIEAAKISNLDCLSLINDTTASALAYGIYSESFNGIKTVAFIDIGYSYFQSNIVKFQNGSMNVVTSSCDQVGGQDFDNVIYKKIKKDIQNSYKLKVVDGTKAGIRLKQECEKLKKMMSANSMDIPISIDCFMNDVDITSKMNRAEFEELSSDLLLKIKNLLKYLLRKAKMTAKDIDSVEITGGSSRIPIVKQIVSEVFLKELRTSLNADESVARGCALQCAVISHRDKVSMYKIIDNSNSNGAYNPYSIQNSRETILKFQRAEQEMQLQVLMENERMSVKNSVEEFIYENREKIENSDLDIKTKENILNVFTSTENWLYEDGEDVSMNEYSEKLEILKKLTEHFLK